MLGLPCSSAGKESACNAGDPGSIPESGRSPGEGIGYSLQYSWVSLLAQTVKNTPALQETWVPSLGWEDALEKGKATHSSLENSMDSKVAWLQRVRHEWTTFTFTHWVRILIKLVPCIFSLWYPETKCSSKYCWQQPVCMEEGKNC